MIRGGVDPVVGSSEFVAGPVVTVVAVTHMIAPPRLRRCGDGRRGGRKSQRGLRRRRDGEPVVRGRQRPGQDGEDQCRGGKGPDEEESGRKCAETAVANGPCRSPFHADAVLPT